MFELVLCVGNDLVEEHKSTIRKAILIR